MAAWYADRRAGWDEGLVFASRAARAAEAACSAAARAERRRRRYFRKISQLLSRRRLLKFAQLVGVGSSATLGAMLEMYAPSSEAASGMLRRRRGKL
jgi:hypothetical protein